MPAVLRLVEVRSDDSVAVLEHMLQQAKSGKVRGILLCHTSDKGVEEPMFTGMYRRRPTLALNAALNLLLRLTQMTG